MPFSYQHAKSSESLSMAGVNFYPNIHTVDDALAQFCSDQYGVHFSASEGSDGKTRRIFEYKCGEGRPGHFSFQVCVRVEEPGEVATVERFFGNITPEEARAQLVCELAFPPEAKEQSIRIERLVYPSRTEYVVRLGSGNDVSTNLGPREARATFKLLANEAMCRAMGEDAQAI